MVWRRGNYSNYNSTTAVRVVHSTTRIVSLPLVPRLDYYIIILEIIIVTDGVESHFYCRTSTVALLLSHFYCLRRSSYLSRTSITRIVTLLLFESYFYRSNCNSAAV
jgi:hypothetical protein